MLLPNIIIIIDNNHNNNDNNSISTDHNNAINHGNQGVLNLPPHKRWNFPANSRNSPVKNVSIGPSNCTGTTSRTDPPINTTPV